jgi:hypothetical protein
MSDHLAELHPRSGNTWCDTVAARLEPHFAGTFGPETIERFVLRTRSSGSFRRPLIDHLPPGAGREVRPPTTHARLPASNLDDPADGDLAAVRLIRDEIRRRVEALLDSLPVEH